MTRDFWRAALIVLAILYLGALVREADESNTAAIEFKP